MITKIRLRGKNYENPYTVSADGGLVTLDRAGERWTKETTSDLQHWVVAEMLLREAVVEELKYSDEQQDQIRAIFRDCLPGFVPEEVLAKPVNQQVAIFRNHVSSRRPGAPPFSICVGASLFGATEEQARLLASRLDWQGLRYSDRDRS